MRLRLQSLLPGEYDPELLWGFVIAAGGVIIAVWLLSGLPTPLCPLHELTGLPCPTCGLTRGVRCLLQGNLRAAFLFNPLMMAAFFGTAFYLVYAATVVTARLPRLRFEVVSKRASLFLRLAVALLIVVNWTYLIIREQIIVGG